MIICAVMKAWPNIWADSLQFFFFFFESEIIQIHYSTVLELGGSRVLFARACCDNERHMSANER
jgi:hypothetical protein